MNTEVKYCDYCGEIIEDEDNFYRGTEGNYCSEECREVNEPSNVCEHCGEWRDCVIWVDDIDMRLCEDCYNREVTTCANCGQEILIEDAIYGEEGRYCSYDCQHDAEGGHSLYVNRYSHKPAPTFFCVEEEKGKETNTLGDKIFYFGIENEFNADSPIKRTETDLMNLNEPIYLKEDGSLDAGGVEVVSHPMTLAYHLTEMGWDDIFSTAVNGGLWSDCRCGMHVHVGVKEFSDKIATKANLVRFFNLFWNDIVELSGREYEEDIEQWAQCPSLLFDNYNEYDESIVENAKIRGRYQAVNLTNSNTIEIRIFQGVNRAKDFYYNLALVNEIVQICDTLSWEDIKNLSFERDVWEPAIDKVKKLTESQANVA